MPFWVHFLNDLNALNTIKYRLKRLQINLFGSEQSKSGNFFNEKAKGKQRKEKVGEKDGYNPDAEVYRSIPAL